MEYFIFIENSQGSNGFFSANSFWAIVASVLGALFGASSSYLASIKKETNIQKRKKELILDEVSGLKGEAAEWMKELEANEDLPVLKLHQKPSPDESQPVIPASFDTAILKERDLLLGSGLSRKERRDVIHLANDASRANTIRDKAQNKLDRSFNLVVPEFTSNDNFELYNHATVIYYFASIILGEVQEANPSTHTSEEILAKLEEAKAFAESKVGTHLSRTS